MLKKKIPVRGAFTLIELIVVIGLISSVLFAGVAVVLVDTHRGWDQMYERIYSDVVTDGYVARRTFDREVRKASGERFLVADDGSWIEVYSYADVNSTDVDRYAYFYEENGNLKVEYGDLSSGNIIRTSTVCGNVSSCLFEGNGRSAQMILTLDNGELTAEVVTSAVMQNW